jgi:hypothetical protein
MESKLKIDAEFRRRQEHWTAEIARLVAEESELRLGGGAKAQERQRAQGKLSARERVAALCDPGAAFLELGLWAAHGMYAEWGGAPAAGVVTGVGSIHGRDVMVVADDATVKAGAKFPLGIKKVLRAQEIALENRLPVVYLVDSAGVFLPMQDEIFPDREHYGRIFYNNARLSAAGVFQMAAIVGSCVAGGAYLPIMSDETHIVEGSGSIFLAGSHLVAAAIGERIENEALGGAVVQADISSTIAIRTRPAASPSCARSSPSSRRENARRSRAARPRRRSMTRRSCSGSCRSSAHGLTTPTSCWRACSTVRSSTNSRRPTAGRWSAAPAGSAATRSASSPISARWSTAAPASSRATRSCRSAA